MARNLPHKLTVFLPTALTLPLSKPVFFLGPESSNFDEYFSKSCNRHKNFSYRCVSSLRLYFFLSKLVFLSRSTSSSQLAALECLQSDYASSSCTRGEISPQIPPKYHPKSVFLPRDFQHSHKGNKIAVQVSCATLSNVS